MNRVGQAFSSKLVLIPVVFLAMLAGAGVGFWVHSDSNRVMTVRNARHQITQISYRGVSGVTAFQLLKKRAHITYRHRSSGDFVESIDGVRGLGPNYWQFYVNNKQSSVSANDYITKNSDIIQWKLQ
jgi:hypothetical protein